jgi:hypothetical protein
VYENTFADVLFPVPCGLSDEESRLFCRARLPHVRKLLEQYHHHGKKFLHELGVVGVDSDNINSLVATMEHAAGLVLDWKESCARGGATLALVLLHGHHKEANLHTITAGMRTERDGESITTAQMEELAYPYGCHVARMVPLAMFRKHMDLPPRLPSDGEEEAGEEETNGDEEAI